PHVDSAVQRAGLSVPSPLRMPVIIVPVIALTLFFAFKYRQSNQAATYSPDWDHSTRLELVIWGAPLLIIIALGAITWISTHKLDPYRPLEGLDAKRPLPAATKPPGGQGGRWDWRWPFVSPDQAIAPGTGVA